MRAIAFDHKLTVAVSGEFRGALATTARRCGATLPDAVRRVLQT